MTALLLRLAAPWQSWGTASRFTRRGTDRAPSKSGVVGLLAAAQGRRRTDEIEDLAGLRTGARIEQAGTVQRDFQTAHTRDGGTAMPLSYRFYLADAVFLVAVEGDEELLRGLQEALRRPAYPLYLGRRSCPPAGRVEHGLRDGSAGEVLSREPWAASPRVRQRYGESTVSLEAVVDSASRAEGEEYLVRDDPVRFDPLHRQYEWRSVVTTRVVVANPDGRAGGTSEPSADPHDPMAALGGTS